MKLPKIERKDIGSLSSAKPAKPAKPVKPVKPAKQPVRKPQIVSATSFSTPTNTNIPTQTHSEHKATFNNENKVEDQGGETDIAITASAHAPEKPLKPLKPTRTGVAKNNHVHMNDRSGEQIGLDTAAPQRKHTRPMGETPSFPPSRSSITNMVPTQHVTDQGTSQACEANTEEKMREKPESREMPYCDDRLTHLKELWLSLMLY